MGLQNKADASHFDSDANTTSEALKYRKKVLAVFLSDTREQQGRNEFTVEKLDSCTNLRVLSAFTKKRLRIRIDFEKLPLLEEVFLEGLYDEQTLKQRVKNDSLLLCSISILDSNQVIPHFINYFPQQTAMVINFKNFAENFDKLSIELEKFLSKANSTNIHFGASGITLLTRN